MRKVTAQGRRAYGLMGLFVVVIVAVALLVPAVATTKTKAYVPGTPKKGNNVWLLLPNTTNQRHESQDRPFFTAAMKKAMPSAKVTVVNAQGSSSKQLAQAEAAISAGADVIALFATDTRASCAIVKEAHAAGIPVIAVEIPITGCPVDYLAAVRVRDLGILQGKWMMAHTKDGDNIAIIGGDRADGNALLFNQGQMSVLGPAFKAGTRHLVDSVFAAAWDPANAQRAMEQILTKANNNIQGVVASNDGMAQGAIAALNAQGMAGKVPVTGNDATLPAVQRILLGTQGMSVLISIKTLHSQVAAIAKSLLQGRRPPAKLFTGGTSFNGVRKVPWAARAGTVITKANYKAAINDGGFTLKQLCQGLPKGTITGC